MQWFEETIHRWQLASGETQALLNESSALLTRRHRLLQAARHEFGDVLRLAREFTDEVADGQEPAARSTLPRSR